LQADSTIKPGGVAPNRRAKLAFPLLEKSGNQFEPKST
jgi:hypothetical protein